MTPVVDDHIFLLGRPPFQELLYFVRTMAQDGHLIDQAALIQEWRAANAHIQSLEQDEAGYADRPTIEPLPAALQPLAARVLADPAFQRGFFYTPCDFGMVELDRLVVWQRSINLGFVSTFTQSVQQPPAQEDLARLAFGLDRPAAPFSFQQSGANTFSFISPSADWRPLDSGILDASQIVSFPCTGRPMAFVALGIGFGTNYFNAISVGDRLILNNGSHRAFALRAMGVTHSPCLIQHVSQLDELQAIASKEVIAKADGLLDSPRPPVLKDYFDPKLRRLVPVPRKNRLVQVQVSISQSDVPA